MRPIIEAPYIRSAEIYGTDYVCYERYGYWPSDDEFVDGLEDDEDEEE